MLTWLLILLVGIPALLVATVISLFSWQHFQTRGLAYFGRPSVERIRFKQRVARIGRWVRPLFRILTFREPDPNQFTICHDGIHAPANTCSRRSFSDAVNYRPQAEDIFVVTQMKCGTTWMQQIVYEILMGGAGNLDDDGHGQLHAISPWLESFNGPEIAEAPRLGESRRRILKTHLPAQLCPDSASAKYVYVTRHPASCFASCRDFFRSSAGEFTPSDANLLDWFCSERMWWGSWPTHVAGWSDRREKQSNVLFLHFEEMKRDLPGVIRRVVAFLGVDCSDAQIETFAAKSAFDFMKKNEERFEMLPPNFFSTGEAFLKSGAIDRHRSLTDEERDRVETFCRSTMKYSPFPFEKYLEEIRASQEAADAS